MQEKTEQQVGLCDALIELKELQDFVIHSRTKHFGKLLAKLVGVDTIPFALHTKEGNFFSMMGSYYNKRKGKYEQFYTTYFRIEEVDKEDCCITISLLRPLDIHGHTSDTPFEVMVLKRTDICVKVDLTCICGIQILDTKLLKRKIICEPKW